LLWQRKIGELNRPSEVSGVGLGEPPMKRFKRGIATKLGICLVASTATIFGVFGYWSLQSQRRGSEALILQGADQISDLIKNSTRYQMLENDREGLYQTIRSIAREPGIERLRILNNEGRAMFSTDPRDLGCVVDKNAPGCCICHSDADAPGMLNRRSRVSIFTSAQGERVMAALRPIENEAACSNAACHAHPASQKVLGVVDAQLKLDAADTQAAKLQKLLARFMVLAVVLLCLVSGAFVWAVLYRPIQDLIKGTRRVAGGDLDYRLTIRSQDELGDVADSFNKMTADLAEARGRLLEQTQNVLARGEQMASLGKLAATVAHEVNNPLFGILTYARLCSKSVAESPIDEELRKPLLEQLEVITAESRRCGEIMRNLLTFARQAPLRREMNDLNELVTRADRLMRHQFEIQGVHVETDLAPGLPPVECDAGQIQQVILVLLVNASEAMPNGGSLQIATERVSTEPAIRLRVRDTGPGIPRDVQPHVFAPFFTTKEERQSTGLGLAVAKSILDQHGGTIEVSSREGEGAEFVVTLPVQQKAQLVEAGAMAYGQPN
jgi:two-component system, NtrC family, sensor kinase